MYNEAAIAEQSLATILSYVRQLPPNVHLLVINDGSRDRTREIVEDVIRREGEGLLTLISHDANQGYGAALRTGIQFAISNHYTYVLFMDSDLTNHPKYLRDFYQKMLEGWDYIKATRYSKGGGVCGVPVSKRIISTAGNLLARILCGIPLTDFTNGFRAVKVSLLEHMALTENKFVIIMEELYQAKGLTRSFSEVPYVLTSRLEDQGATHFSYSFKTCRHYFKYVWWMFINRKRNS